MKSYRRHFIGIITSILIAVLCVSTLFCVPPVNAVTSAVADNDSDTEIITEETVDNYYPGNPKMVLSYKDVFYQYYLQAEAEINNCSIEMPYSFEEFSEMYYWYNLDIKEYTEYIVDNVCVNNDISLLDNDISELSSSSVADYIFKEISNPDITPYSYFSREYNNEMFDFSAIKDGDILVETETVLNDIGHAALVYDISRRGYDKEGNVFSYIQTIEAVSRGVSYGFLDDNRMVKYGVVVLRVSNCDDKNISKAKYFAEEQIGKDYSFPITGGRVNTSINSEEWYCSELVYAAYYYSGIRFSNAIKNDYCLPFDLISSSTTSYVCISDCVDCMMMGKTDGKWKFNVYNSTDTDVTLEYNSKLCFESDAKKWSKSLKHIETVTIPAGSYVTVYISGNGTARNAAFSTESIFTDAAGKSVTTRNVTYCHSLNTSTMRYSVIKNIITE